MEIRKPFQGVTNIVRFNWHFYVLAVIALGILFFLRQLVPHSMVLLVTAAIIAPALFIIISLAVSYYIYDLSGLYSLHWLDRLTVKPGAQLANIHAGFDETSALLAAKYPGTQVSAFDFYDPVRHTEVAIRRARKAYPPYSGTTVIKTDNPLFAAAAFDHIFAILAAHEVRDHNERVVFFKALRLALKPGGRIVVVEHLRNMPNFMAYNIGFLHFFSATEWQATFDQAGFSIEEEFAVTPFIRAFILKQDGIIP